MSPDDKPVNAVPAEGKAEEKTPEEIRAEIDETRGELGDTVEALAEKTDVKAQAKAKVDDAKAQAQDKVEEVKAQARAVVEEVKENAPESPQEAQALARQNQKPLAIAGGVVVLFLLWRWLRS